MVKNKKEKSERNSSIAGETKGNQPKGNDDDIRTTVRADSGKSSATSTTAGPAPPNRQQPQPHLEQSPRQERHKWTPGQSPNVLRNRKTRRSSLSTMDILNGLMNDSARFDLLVGGGSATSIHKCVDDAAGSSSRDDEQGPLSAVSSSSAATRGKEYGQLNVDGGEASGDGQHFYGVLNDVDPSLREESARHRMQRHNTRNGGNGGQQVRRSSSLTTLGELCRRSSLGHLDLFGNSMLLNDSFVFKLQGSETFLQSAGAESKDQATTERRASADTSSSAKKKSSHRLSWGGGRGETWGDGGIPLTGETEQTRTKKNRPTSRRSSLSSMDVKNQHSFSTLRVLDGLLQASASSKLCLSKMSDLTASSDLRRGNNHKHGIEKEEEEKSPGKTTSETHVGGGVEGDNDSDLVGGPLGVIDRLVRGITSRLLCSLACVVLIAIASCIYFPKHRSVGYDTRTIVEKFAKASSGVLSSGWGRALDILGSNHSLSVVTDGRLDVSLAVDNEVLRDISTGNQNLGSRELLLAPPKKNRRSPLKISQPKFKGRRKQRRPNWKRQKKRNKKVSLPAEASSQSIGQTRMFTSLYFKWTKGRGRRRRRPCATADDNDSNNDDSKGIGSLADNIFERDSFGGGKGKGKGQGLHERQTEREDSGSDDFALKGSKSAKGGKGRRDFLGRSVKTPAKNNVFSRFADSKSYVSPQDSKAAMVPCSSFPSIETETTIRLGELKSFNLFTILAATKENTVAVDQRLYNVTKEISSIQVGNETFFLEGGGDFASFRIEESDASVTMFLNGTMLVSGGKEPSEICFDYAITSREESGEILMLGMATETGTHCITVRPHHAYTATVGEIDDLPDHSIAQSILSGMNYDDSSVDGGSIVEIIIPGGKNGEDGNPEIVVPRAGDIIVLRYGNMTIDPISGMMIYAPNPSHMESLGSGDEFIEYFDYVTVNKDGTTSTERVTIRVVGEETAATDPSTSNPSSNPSSLPTEGPLISAAVFDPPTASPTDAPTDGLTSTPSSKPSAGPSPKPTEGPTSSPSSKPSAGPSPKPTEGPTSSPSSKPSAGPSPKPTEGPTSSPSSKPSAGPSPKPTEGPTGSPSSKPSSSPTPKPTNAPPIAKDNAYGRTVEQLNNDGGRIVGEILTNDSDPDGELGDLTITSITVVGPGGDFNTFTNSALDETSEYSLENGTFTIDPNTGLVEYTPDPAKVAALSGSPGSILTDTFKHIITDEDGGTDIATATFTVVGHNGPPVPEDDSETVPEGDDVSDCVFENDSDPDEGDTLKICDAGVRNTKGEIIPADGTKADMPEGGTLSITTDGCYTFSTSNGDFESLGGGETAEVCFTYLVCDIVGASASAEVCIEITGENDPPMAEDDSYLLSTDDPIVKTDIVEPNDSDPEDDKLTILTLDGVDVSGVDVNGVFEQTLASGGVIKVNPATGDITYDGSSYVESLGADEEFVDTVPYTIGDGNGGTDMATITFIVPGKNDPPMPEDDSETVPEGEDVSDCILTNDSDPDGDDLRVCQVTFPDGTTFNFVEETQMPGGGTLSITTDGCYTFSTSNGDFESLGGGETAESCFKYWACDGRGGSAEAEVCIEITGENDPPMAEDDSYLLSTDDPIVKADIVEPNDSDPEDDKLTILTLDGVDVSGVDVNGVFEQTLASGGVIKVNPATGDITYDGSSYVESLGADDEFVDKVPYTISDGNGGTDMATITFIVPGKNDPPVAEDDSYLLSADAPIVKADIIEPNDSDPEDDKLTILTLDGVDVSGVVGGSGVYEQTLPSGGVIKVNPTTGDITYDGSSYVESLGADEEFVDTVPYTISDGNGGTDMATITFIVPGKNDPPMPEDDSETVPEGEDVSDCVLTNDSDPDGDDLKVCQVTFPDGTAFSFIEETQMPGGGTLSITTDGCYTFSTSNGDFEHLNSGETTESCFKYWACDEYGGSVEAEVCIEVNGESHPSSSPSKDPTSSPSASPSSSPSSEPSSDPSSSPSSSLSSHPSSSPSSMPSVGPSLGPTVQPSDIFSNIPSDFPSSKPSSFPSTSAGPSQGPSASPSLSTSPSNPPSSIPSSGPSSVPSFSPSESTEPSNLPSAAPSSSLIPTSGPSALPSVDPSHQPSSNPTVSLAPSSSPSQCQNDAECTDQIDCTIDECVDGYCSNTANNTACNDGNPCTLDTCNFASGCVFDAAAMDTLPCDDSNTFTHGDVCESGVCAGTHFPSTLPSSAPSELPTMEHSGAPSDVPSQGPSSIPSRGPSYLPSGRPSVVPSVRPSISTSPSALPSDEPTLSSAPSSGPSDAPSSSPSSLPSDEPSVSARPSQGPSAVPSSSTSPSALPSDEPSSSPSSLPSDEPSVSVSPSSLPSDEPSVSVSPSSLPSDEPSVSVSPSSLPSDEPSVSARPSQGPSAVPSSSTSPSALPSDEPSSSPSSLPSDEPSVSESPSSLPSDEPSVSSAPSSGPSDAPSSSPSSLPSDEPSVSTRPSSVPSDIPSSSPSSLPSDEPSVSVSPSSAPSNPPSISLAPSSLPSDEPSFIPSVLPSAEPTLSLKPSLSPSAIPSDMPSDQPITAAQEAALTSTCVTTYRNLTFPTAASSDEDETIGNLLYCGNDEDCGGVGFTDPITGEIISYGATCNMATCHCECSAEYCLLQPVTLNADNTKKNNEVLLDVGCQFQCECKKKCSLPGNWTGAADATALERCTNECTSCVDDPGACGADEDCIDGICVESGICTAKKEAMCDDAYAAVSGKKNQRAKCCPDTSGCIKSTIGVIATSSCGNVCGTSCLGSETNPGNAFGYSPSTFCMFGQRVQNMPYCPIVASNYTATSTLGVLSCTGGNNDNQGDNSICCSDQTHKGAIGDSINGLWNCGEGSAGNTTQYALGWPGSPEGAFMCIRDEDSKSNLWTLDVSTAVC